MNAFVLFVCLVACFFSFTLEKVLNPFFGQKPLPKSVSFLKSIIIWEKNRQINSRGGVSVCVRARKVFGCVVYLVFLLLLLLVLVLPVNLS